VSLVRNASLIVYSSLSFPSSSTLISTGVYFFTRNSISFSRRMIVYARVIMSLTYHLFVRDQYAQRNLQLFQLSYIVQRPWWWHFGIPLCNSFAFLIRIFRIAFHLSVFVGQRSDRAFYLINIFVMVLYNLTYTFMLFAKF